MKKINCLGILVVDALCGPLENYPVPRLQTQVTTESIRFFPGGGAANTTSALARMGFHPAAFSKVGNDPNGAFLIRELEECGVDTTGIRVSERDTTPFTFVGIHPDGDRTFIHTPGANRTFCLDDLNTERLFSADFLLYQDLWVLPSLDGDPGAKLLSEAKDRGLTTLLDECWGFGPDRESLEIMLPHCDYVLPSLDDMIALYPGASAEQLASILLGKGAHTVVLKLGAQGCLVAQGKDMTLIPASPTEVVDTTGAGDCWDAGFLAGLASGEDALTSARIGNACAAFCITAVGGSTGVPDYASVRQEATTLPATPSAQESI